MFLITCNLKYAALSRAEEISLRHFFPVWSHPRYCCLEDSATERASICRIQGHFQCHHCLEVNARISILRQAYGGWFGVH